MSWHPPIAWNLLLPLVGFGLALIAWLSWRGVAVFGRTRGLLLTALRLVGVLGLLLCFANPGHWRQPEVEGTRKWILLLDESQSMATLDGEAVGKTRWASAAKLANQLIAEGDEGVAWRGFAGTLSAPEEKPPEESHLPKGEESDLLGSTTTLLGASSGNELAGIVVLGDGRQTHDTSLEETVLRAQAQDIPIHTVGLGGDVIEKNLALSATRRQWMAFPEQSVTVGVRVSAHGLGDLRVPLTFSENNAEASVIEAREVAVKDGETVTAAFTVTAPATSYTISTPAWEGESRESDNTLTIHIRVVTTKTRVFLAEGAPYWDSKFLAQLFRQQAYVDLRSVHRLSDTRYFQIDSAREEPVATEVDTFPETAEALAAYDLIAFGKGIEPFMTETRLQALRTYVRDHGGAVLFARGRAYSGQHPGLAALEPVVWKESKRESFHFRPTAEGESAGLFGETLPGPNEAIWKQLPPLQDAHEVDSVKPFTRVLAHGVTSVEAPEGTGFPLLAVRRYGLGVIGIVNADGLWKWDFFPKARSTGNMYEDYWSQLIQWMASYSEFLPGQQYSLRLNKGSAKVDELVSATVGWRPESAAGAVNSPSEPSIHLVHEKTSRMVTPAAVLQEDGRTQWRATFAVAEPGPWLLQLRDAAGEALNGPEVVLTATEPPGELDNRNADPSVLKELAERTGGRFWTPAEAAEGLAEVMEQPPVVLSGDLEWDPLWMRWPWLLTITLFFAFEWWLRRRWGSV